MMDPTLARPKRLAYNIIERLLALRTTRMIAVSPEEARAAVAVGLGRSRIATVPNGIAPMRLATREVARRTIGAGPGDILIGFVGRLVTQKGIEVLVKAFAGVARFVPNARLAMVGDGPLGPAMKALAAECGVAEKIYWLGERDARQVWAGFDVFALASWKEGLPYVVIEAMATGLPIVATTSAGVEILVEEGVNGHTVPPGDVAAFARALTNIVGDPARLARFGQASLKQAERFTAERMVEETMTVYREAGVNVPARADELPSMLEPAFAMPSPSPLETSAAY
jgi:glycosyltransferase involved in cell wall biosynthesis